MCQCGHCKTREAPPGPHRVRWVCLCGNLIKEEDQIEGLDPSTISAVGTCCASILPEDMQHKAMPLSGNMEAKPQAHDQRSKRRDTDG